jgi:Domain of unknown function (DUF3850)
MIENGGTVHELKSWPLFFQDVIWGRKRFEIRRADRKFEVEDMLELEEYNPATKTYTGARTRVLVTYVQRLESIGIPDFVGMGIRKLL